MKKALQFGAGNIGRGFIGQLFYESGYEIVFVDIADDVVNEINLRQHYKINFACEPPQQVVITGIRAVNAQNVDKVAEEFATAHIVCTAVGVNALSKIAPAIAKGIELRASYRKTEPVNIIICENLRDANHFLREQVMHYLKPDLHDYLHSHIGFVMSVVARMVPFQSHDREPDDALSVLVEPYKILPVDKSAFVGRIPKIVGLEPRDNFAAWVDDKLYTHNCGHAVAAYLGYIRGHKFMHTALLDPFIKKTTYAAMSETGNALIRHYRINPKEHWRHVDDLIARMANRNLGDQVVRVGRDPLRKLAQNDRLIGAARFCIENGVFPENVCLGIAAALFFDYPDDPTAEYVRSIVENEGPATALERVSGLSDGDPIRDAVLNLVPTIKNISAVDTHNDNVPDD